MRIYKIAQTQTPQGTHSKEEFLNLGSLQRGTPEQAMLKLTMYHAGVLASVVEHAGDIMHRMNETPTFDDAGFHFVKPKVEKVLRALQYEYPFTKEHLENMQNNAEYNKVDLNLYKKKVKDLLRNYTAAHKALPVFNKAQKVTQDAVVAIGEERFNDAISNLQILMSYLNKGPIAWKTFAHEGLQEITPPQTPTNENATQALT